MSSTLVFDIETVPDTDGLRKLHELAPELSDAEVAEFAFQRRRAATGGDFLPLHMHRVIVISCVLADRSGFRVWSLTAERLEEEGAMIQRFFDGIEKYTPQIVSWNGGGFDLPVLHYRGLMHGVTAPRYWDWGDGSYSDSREFRFNNYVNRYHTRHVDLMDVLAMFQPRANAPLDELAKLMGYPGKLGMEGGAVWDAFRAGRFADIRDYCETDVVNTYLVYLGFQKMRGSLSIEDHQNEVTRVATALEAIGADHWYAYLDAWDNRPEAGTAD